MASTERLWDLKLVDDYAVVIDFAQVVGLSQIVPGNFVIFGNVVALTQTAYSQVYILYPSIAMHKDYVVVEQIHIEQYYRKLYQKCDEQSHHST